MRKNALQTTSHINDIAQRQQHQQCTVTCNNAQSVTMACSNNNSQERASCNNNNKVHNNAAICINQGSHSFTEKKSRTFQDPHKNFSRTFTEPTNTWISRKMRKNNHLLTLFKGMVHCSKQKLYTAWSTLLLTLALQSQSDIEWTYLHSRYYTYLQCLYVHFPRIFFPDFPGPGILKKKNPGLSRRRGNPVTYTSSHQSLISISSPTLSR